MGKPESKITHLFRKARNLFSRRNGVYVALIRGEDGCYSEILVTDTKEVGQMPEEIIAPPRPEPGEKLKVFVSKPDVTHPPVQPATNGVVPPPTEPWRWTNPSYADQDFFEEFQQILKDQRAELFPIEDEAE